MLAGKKGVTNKEKAHLMIEMKQQKGAREITKNSSQGTSYRDEEGAKRNSKL